MNLQMTGNKIGNKGGMYFAQALQINMSLEALDLCDTDQVWINTTNRDTLFYLKFKNKLTAYCW